MHKVSTKNSMCVICVYMYVCTYTHISTYMWMHENACVHTNINTNMLSTAMSNTHPPPCEVRRYKAFT